MPLPGRVKLAPAIEAPGQARGNLRVEGIKLADLGREEMVSTAVGSMKTYVVVAEGVDQCVDFVRIVQVESRVAQQAPYRCQCPG